MINCLLWIPKKILSLPFVYVLSNIMGKMGIRLLTRIMKNDRSILIIDTAYQGRRQRGGGGMRGDGMYNHPPGFGGMVFA